MYDKEATQTLVPLGHIKEATLVLLRGGEMTKDLNIFMALVPRLRAIGAKLKSERFGDDDLMRTRITCEEAADEIERLETELSEERSMHTDVDAALNEEADETERLRSLLENAIVNLELHNAQMSADRLRCGLAVSAPEPLAEPSSPLSK